MPYRAAFQSQNASQSIAGRSFEDGKASSASDVSFSHLLIFWEVCTAAEANGCTVCDGRAWVLCFLPCIHGCACTEIFDWIRMFMGDSFSTVSLDLGILLKKDLHYPSVCREINQKVMNPIKFSLKQCCIHSLLPPALGSRLVNYWPACFTKAFLGRRKHSILGSLSFSFPHFAIALSCCCWT